MEIDGESTAFAPHGQKRQSDDDLENEQRLAKRFNLLSVGMSPTALHDITSRLIHAKILLGGSTISHNRCVLRPHPLHPRCANDPMHSAIL